MRARKIAVVVGDTRGHFYPALAVADAYRRRADSEAVFFGPRGIGAELAARQQYPYCQVSSAPLVRAGVGARVVAVGRTLHGLAEARRALTALGTQIVLGFGSYASGPVVLAARTLGVPTVIVEANRRPGLANRWLARIAHRICLNHPATPARFPARRVRVTGWPVRGSVCALSDLHREPPDPSRPARILVWSGTRGSAFMADEVPAMLARVVGRGRALDVHHQSGDVAPGPIVDAYARAHVSAKVSPFVDDVPAVYRWADLAITRAGAGTLAELAIAGLPALLVPLADAAHDHQSDNADGMSAAGAALWTREGEWDARDLAGRICHLLTDRGAWREMSASARRMAAPAAADIVVDECEALIGGGRA